MPYAIEKQGKKWVVRNTSTGKVKGTHDSKIKAQRQINLLKLVTDDRHKQITSLETRIKNLEGRVTLLETENILLRRQLNGTWTKF